jgi:hypothetical protein
VDGGRGGGGEREGSRCKAMGSMTSPPPSSAIMCIMAQRKRNIACVSVTFNLLVVCAVMRLFVYQSVESFKSIIILPLW